MTADGPADAHKAALIAWLQQQRDALDPAVVVLRDRDGHVVVELPRNGRESPTDDVTHDMTDDLFD
jgi:hypothetical protein